MSFAKTVENLEGCCETIWSLGIGMYIYFVHPWGFVTPPFPAPHRRRGIHLQGAVVNQVSRKKILSGFSAQSTEFSPKPVAGPVGDHTDLLTDITLDAASGEAHCTELEA